jgi:competence protein ComFC
MKRLLDMLYPRRCIGCGIISPKTFRYICWDCWSDNARVESPFCDHCGDPVAGTIEHDFICYACTSEKPGFDGARSAARYDGAIGEALRQLKYEHALWLAPDLAEVLRNCIKAEYSNESFDLLVPVPLHHVRRRDRGYNQSAVLSQELSRRIKCPSIPGLLRRIRPTTSQTNLTAKERLSNVSLAFQYRSRRRLAGQKILLIDDVMTTGATVNACAKALKKGGAATVHVITVARG